MTQFFRPDIEVLSATSSTTVLVKRSSGESFAFGPGERVLIELLADGKTVEEVVAIFPTRTDRAISPRHVREFVENLRQLRLLSDDAERQLAGEPPLRPATAAMLPVEPHEARWANFWFDVLAILFGWVVSPWMLAPVLVLIVMGGNIVAWHAPALSYDLARVGDGYPVWILLLFGLLPKMLLLNLMHAILVGIAGRRYGASIRNFGLGWWNLIPCFRTDLGNSFAFMDRHGRRTLISLGFWFPLAVGSLALIGWSMARPGSSLAAACLMLLPACFVRLIVHCNVFFDGSSAYLLLCDWVGEWKLLPWALDETRAWLGGHTSPRPLSSRERSWLRTYGLAYYAYRLLVSLAVVLVGLWWITPAFELPGALATLFVLAWFNQDLWPDWLNAEPAPAV